MHFLWVLFAFVVHLVQVEFRLLEPPFLFQMSFCAVRTFFWVTSLQLLPRFPLSD